MRKPKKKQEKLSYRGNRERRNIKESKKKELRLIKSLERNKRKNKRKKKAKNSHLLIPNKFNQVPSKTQYQRSRKHSPHLMLISHRHLVHPDFTITVKRMKKHAKNN